MFSGDNYFIGTQIQTAPVFAAPDGAREAARRLIGLHGVSKSFGGRPVLTNVDFDVAPAEVHALVGENGAGKSTLMNIISGVLPADSGQMFWEGRAVRLRGPREARNLGIAFVHQELALVPELSVAENIFLGRHPAHHGWIRWQSIRARAARMFEELGQSIDPRRRVADLSLAERRLVEVARALAFDARLIIMDEPTAALPDTDAERLCRMIRRLRQYGVSFVFVSHRMKDVFRVADRITVLRDGRPVFSRRTSETHERELVCAMAGSALLNTHMCVDVGTRGEELLRIEGAVNLTVGRGEIVGLTGLAGAGCTELLESLFGMSARQPGQVFIDGQPVVVRSPRDAIRHGMAFVPDDPTAKSLIPAASLQANIALAAGRSRFFIDSDEERRKIPAVVSKLRIRASGLDQPVSSFSGGNQQKAVLARWIFAGARVFLLDEPASGIDTRSKAEIRELIGQLASRGAAVLLASAEVEELLRVAHRIVVMQRGRIAGELSGPEATEERVLRLATGSGL